MNCPTCRGDTRVVQTIGADRRRECVGACRQRFTTTEVLKTEHERLQEAVEVVRSVADRLKVEA